jgi:hypothetical protein
VTVVDVVKTTVEDLRDTAEGDNDNDEAICCSHVCAEVINY